MPQINCSALVSFSAKQMYELVNDAEAYPSFLPGCVDSQVISRTECNQVASIDVVKMGIRKRFTTSNTMIPDSAIHLDLVDGPFNRLKGIWNFTPIDDNSCQIEFHLDFEFTNSLIDFVFNKIFNELMGNMMQAFIKRAKLVYGG